MRKTKLSRKDGNERRAFMASELRALDDNGQKTLGGYAIVFNSASKDLGGFVEVCDPGMLTRTLREQPQVLALRDHNPSQLLGNTDSGTLALKVDDKGLAFRIAVPDTEIGHDTYTNVQNGNLKGVSFGFKTRSDSWSKTADGQVVRRLLDIDLAEISPTSFAAYDATNVSLRSCPAEIRSLLDLGGLFDEDDEDEEDIDPETGKPRKKKNSDDEQDSLGVDAFDRDGLDEADFLRHARLQLALRRIRA